LAHILVSFLTLTWSKEISDCQTDLHQTVSDGRQVGVDVQSGIGFAIGQCTLPWQPILGAKSAEIGDTPSFLIGSRVPQRMAGWES